MTEEEEQELAALERLVGKLEEYEVSEPDDGEAK